MNYPWVGIVDGSRVTYTRIWPPCDASLYVRYIYTFLPTVQDKSPKGITYLLDL